LEIHPFDPEINVTWPVTGEPILSPKDANAPSLAQRLAANELPLFS
jgi:dTDP-4-dehydrorhamnose 3,5-epimerase-like enzyme